MSLVQNLAENQWKTFWIVHDENRLKWKVLEKAEQQGKDSLQKFKYFTYLWIKGDSSLFEPNL